MMTNKHIFIRAALILVAVDAIVVVFMILWKFTTFLFSLFMPDHPAAGFAFLGTLIGMCAALLFVAVSKRWIMPM